jgi:hypothetical protein
MRTIQMQQLTSSFTSETQSTAQSADFIKKWTADEIDFFDSNVDDDDSVVNAKRHVFYKNIYAFVNRLKNMITIREDDKLRIVLSQCFRDAALIWHSIELFDMKKDLFRQINLSFWYQALVNRFKKRTFLTLFVLQNFKYTLNDARFEKDLRLFAQQIFRSIKTVNMNSIHNQLTIAWNNLDWRFRANIFESTITTFIRKFLNQLDFMSNIWHEMIKSQNTDQSKTIRDRFQNPRRTQKYSAYFFRSNSSSFYQRSAAYFNNQFFYQYFDSRQNEYRDRFEYRNRNIRAIYQSRNTRNTYFDLKYFKKKSQSFDFVLLFARQLLQIIDENANASDFSYSEIKSKNNRDYKNKDRAYVTEENEHEDEMNISLDDEYYHEQNSNLNYYDLFSNDQNQLEVEANFFMLAQTFRCRKCKIVFFSNNQLHKHLRQNMCMKKLSISQFKIEDATTHLAMNMFIVKFTIDSFKNIDTNFEFRDWTYVKIMISLFIKSTEAQVCLNIECSVTLVDRKFIKIYATHYIIRRMTTSLNVRDLRINKHEISKYIIVSIYLAEKSAQEKFIREIIRREVHLMNDLKINMLIENDILDSERIFIDDVNSKIIIVSCQNMIISIEIRTFSKEMINKTLHVRSFTIISSRSMTIIFIHQTSLSTNRNFLFKSQNLNLDVFLYAYTVDSIITAIMIKNESEKFIKISRNERPESLIEILYSNAFHVEKNDVQEYVERKSVRTHKFAWFTRVLKAALVVYTIVFAITTFISKTPQNLSSKSQNVVLINDVIVHNFTSQTIISFTRLINQYSDLCKSDEFVKLSENQWMRISLRSDWESRVFEKVKIYSLRTKNKKLVNQTFDDLQRKERLKYITESIFFSYLVFVVWKTINDQKKERVIINIRDLNAITLFDVYSLFLQSNIISAVKECHYLSIIDCASFFYQWRVYSENRHKLIVVSHRDQKTFQIAIMSYKNSSSYVQRQIDRLFRGLFFVKAFIDDIIIYSRTMNEHVDHLNQIFTILINNEIFINLKKAFLKYSSIQLLDQKVNSLNLTIDEEKLKTIFKLKFSRTLKQLKTYLDLIEWMKEYVLNYAAVSQSLQDRKTLLLKNSLIFDSVRRKFSFFIRLLNSTSTKKQTFNSIQSALFKSRRLIHVDIERQLYDDVDVSKKFDIDVMIYHVKDDRENITSSIELSTVYSSRSSIELILFLSRQLKSIEKNYWSTKLKIAKIVFIIRKIRHMIESFKKSIILFIDHESVLDIVKQIDLVITFTDKLNLRLIRAFEYIQRFNLIIKHKSEKQHIVFDALSRLISKNDDINISDSKELDALFIITLIEMKFTFKAKIIDEYFTDSKWNKILHTLSKNIIIKLSFTLKSDFLIYRSDQIALNHVYEFKRLCISSIVIKNILNIAHDTEHFDFVKCYDIISFSWYIHELTKHLRQYLRHCLKCQVFQIRRHKSYDSLQSILTSNVSFHIITIDFILTLSDIDKYDCAMFVICKFSKRICLILEKTSWKTKDWALTLLSRLKIMNWELFKAIISNRDSKFLIELWIIIFDRSSVKLLYSTVYHSQSDEQSKRSNQIMKIALRFHLFILNNSKKWSSCLSIIQSHMNNFIISLDKTLNEIVYEFISIQSTDLTQTKDIVES